VAHACNPGYTRRIAVGCQPGKTVRRPYLEKSLQAPETHKKERISSMFVCFIIIYK
jgi:hypothetical protein